MIETLHILEQAQEAEARHLLKLINELEGGELYAFINQLASLKLDHRAGTHDDVLCVARNVKGIMDAIESFYTT